jgi:hypothetical protein
MDRNKAIKWMLDQVRRSSGLWPLGAKSFGEDDGA